MITASLPWPRKADARAVAASSRSSGERSWLISTGTHAPGTNAPRSGPRPQPPRRLSLGQAIGAAPQPVQDVSAASAAASTARTGDGQPRFPAARSGHSHRHLRFAASAQLWSSPVPGVGTKVTASFVQPDQGPR